MDLSAFLVESKTEKAIKTIKTIKLSDKSWYKISTNFLELSTDEIRQIIDLCPTHHHIIKMFGKEVAIPRYQDLYATDTKFKYNFSGSFIPAKDITKCSVFQKALKQIKEFDTDYSAHYNAVFVNWYMNGKHYIGPHSDDEKDLVENAPIYSLSYGDVRTFRITKKLDKSWVTDIELTDGMMIAMCGEFQKEFKHEILRKPSSNKRRINLTVRAFV